jgi:hypothetical protein
VTVLTPKALRASAINPAAVNAQIEAARRPADTPEARAAQQQTIAKARAQLRVANKGGGTATAGH